MNKVLVFNVRVKGLEDKIWRKMEIVENTSLSDFCYFILSTFELFSGQFFTITCDNMKYDCASYLYDTEDYKSVMSVNLNDLKLDSNKEMILEYGSDFNINLIINYVESKMVKDITKLPKIIDGAGKSALDYVSEDELKEIVEETDKLGYSTYSITIVEDDKEEEEFFDYRDFDLDSVNVLSKCNTSCLEYEYESEKLSDFIRIINDRNVFFYKADIKDIVNPYDYMKQYLPDNYYDLSREEIDKLNIPTREDLHIYQLPKYEDINHKEIMTRYVKNNVEDKEARKELFCALRNYDYMDKFYNNLRKHRLFKDYLEYSSDYYEKIIDRWGKENNVK